jgi:hypothetical protein
MNLTDNEIIKALECCNEMKASECSECPLLTVDCSEYDLYKLALDLINRQKAEIERLQAMVEREREKYERTMTGLKAVLEERTDHSEAIKEFAERLKEYGFICQLSLDGEQIVYVKDIDNLVKEMARVNEDSN